MSENVLAITDSSFNKEVIKAKLPVLVDFWAEWCGPCRMIAPTIDALAKDYKGEVVVAKLDTDQAPKTAMSLGIHSIPTLIFFKDGEQVDRRTGAHPRATIESAMKKHF